MTPKQEAWAIQAEHVIKQMERRHFNAYYCSTKEEALTKALSIIEKGSVIASGGSATLGEVGLLDYIKNHSEDYTFIDRSIAKTEDESYKQGIELVLKQLKDVLTSNGVKEIETIGKTFDPELHEAVASVVDENLGEKEIKEENRKGYILGNKVIRHSMVVVAN